MKAYLHKSASHLNVAADFKEVVPDALMRRRMSKIVKYGVLAAHEALEGTMPDAIITATAFGCLKDSEKFLRTWLDSNEELLAPTAFIQSTFNTIGAAIAQLNGCHCYNMTYAHGADGFGAGLLDAMMLLEERKAGKVLLGAAEEFTPTAKELMQRVGVTPPDEEGGAFFFRLGRERADAEAELEVTLTEGHSVRRFIHPLELPQALHSAVETRMDLNMEFNGLNIVMKCL